MLNYKEGAGKTGKNSGKNWEKLGKTGKNSKKKLFNSFVLHNQKTH